MSSLERSARFTAEHLVLKDAALRLRRARHATRMLAPLYEHNAHFAASQTVLWDVGRATSELAGVPLPDDNTSIFRFLDNWHTRRDIRNAYITVPHYASLAVVSETLQEGLAIALPRIRNRTKAAVEVADALQGTYKGRALDGRCLYPAADIIGRTYQDIAAEHFATVCEVYGTKPKR